MENRSANYWIQKNNYDGIAYDKCLEKGTFLLMGEGKPPFKGNLRYKYAPLCSLGPYIS